MTTMVSENEVETALRAMIADIAEIEPERITPEANFVTDLGMDSMMALEILAGIEKRFKVQIPEEKLAQLKNLRESVHLTIGYLKVQ